jgi:hypothetical protein
MSEHQDLRRELEAARKQKIDVYTRLDVRKSEAKYMRH